MFEDGFRTAEGNCNIWNARFAGTEAFTKPNNRGYKTGSVNKVMYYKHRIVWAMHGRDDVEIITHINGNSSDDRIENLSASTKTLIGINAKVKSNSRSKQKGVYWSSLHQMWRSSIDLNGKRTYLGLYPNIYDAIKARSDAQKEANNGSFDI